LKALADNPEVARKVEWALVWLIALHTFAIGLALLLVPEWALRLGGWKEIPSLFFPRQAGIFHFVLGFGYLRELRCRGSVSLLVLAKGAAFLFLIGSALVWTPPWFVPFAGVTDGMMGLAAWWIHRAAAPDQASGARHPHTSLT